MTFREFFSKATGYPPFPYQQSLAQADMTRLALAAPTGAGKTAAATLAWLWQRHKNPEATPTRLILCEPQRTLVEQVFAEVEKWLANLGLEKTITLHALQGGYIDQRWELHPEQPAVIIGTQDQLLSRALNRGYAMSRFRWPIHFGLFHNDVQWVFDEIQLMGPGLVTSAQLHGLREKLGYLGQAKTLWMSATLNPQWLSTVDHVVNDGQRKLEIHPFTTEDKAVEEMAARLHAKKPLHKLSIGLAGDSKDDNKAYLEALAKEVARLHQPGHFTLVIINTVKRARELHERLSKLLGADKLHLLHSRFRPQDRMKVLQHALSESGEKIVISTQVVEAGVDISADLLISELAPRSSMIQRFGRCNRKGRQDHAQVHWIELGEKSAAPYEWADLKPAIQQLEQMDSVEPAQFPDRIDEAWPVVDTLRRRDLLDLFDTTSDLSGLDLDVSRFIRDGDQRDIFIFWRRWYSEKPALDLDAPRHGELCKVSKYQAVELVKKKRLALWQLDDLSGKKAEWRQAREQDLVAGRIYLAHCDQGCYTEREGWSPDSKTPVPELARAGEKSPFPSMAGDSLSEKFEGYLTLWEHTKNVCDELELILPGLKDRLPDKASEKLRTAALWHDIGKAHPVFQETMLKDSDPEKVDPSVQWAKRIGSAFHSRRYFRHELASALVALRHDLDFLITYLIASHHGKARVSIRSFPDEPAETILGVQETDTMPAINFPNLQLPECQLSLQPFRLGRGSWQDQALALRDQIGPFALAYLEAILRAADVRASIKEKVKLPAHAN